MHTAARRTVVFWLCCACESLVQKQITAFRNIQTASLHVVAWKRTVLSLAFMLPTMIKDRHTPTAIEIGIQIRATAAPFNVFFKPTIAPYRSPRVLKQPLRSDTAKEPRHSALSHAWRDDFFKNTFPQDGRKSRSFPFRRSSRHCTPPRLQNGSSWNTSSRRKRRNVGTKPVFDISVYSKSASARQRYAKIPRFPPR